MADPTTQTAQIVVDKNKSNEDYIKEAEALYIVPKLVREKFPDLVKLAYETESMDAEEREYWMQILPIMSEEQIVKLRDILVNEKKQLSELDNQYKNQMEKVQAAPDIDEAAMKKKLEEIKAAEIKNEEAEKSEEDKLLEELNNL